MTSRRFTFPTLAEIRAEIASVGLVEGRPGPSDPQVSFAIATLNDASGLARTLAALPAAVSVPFEIVVADGGSTDGTVDMLRAPDCPVTRWMSGSDTGISHGFNRAIALARAPLVKLINADDWPAAGAIDAGVAALAKDPGLDLVYGPVQMIDAQDRPTRRLAGAAIRPGQVVNSLVLAPHPSWIVPRATYERVGLYSPSLRYTMDYEWLLRLLAAGGRLQRIEALEVIMREGGASTRGRLTRDRENYAITRAYGAAPWLAARGMLAAKTTLNGTESVLERVLPARVAGWPRAAVRSLLSARRRPNRSRRGGIDRREG